MAFLRDLPDLGAGEALTRHVGVRPGACREVGETVFDEGSLRGVVSDAEEGIFETPERDHLLIYSGPALCKSVGLFI